MYVGVPQNIFSFYEFEAQTLNPKSINLGL